MTNLRSLDLNLLPVFAAVFETGSITRAAQLLALSPSATSHALGRLRDACRDDLFVRVGQGIAPTPVASRIYPEIRRALDALRASLDEANGFVPETSTRHFRIGLPHPAGPLWALAIDRAAREAAPGVRIEFDTRSNPDDQADRMRAGGLDLAVDWRLPEDDRFVTRRLYGEELVVIARRGHPRVAPGLSLAALGKERLVRVRPRPGPEAEPIRLMAETLIGAGVTFALEVSEQLEVPYLVLQTDLLGIIPRSLARAQMHEVRLEVIELPIAARPIPIHLLWHETRRADDGHRWLRDLAADTVTAVAAA